MSVALQDTRTTVMLSATTASAAGTSKGYLDTLGWDHARIIATTGTYSSGTHAMAVLSLTEATNSAAATAIPAFTGTTNTVTVSGTSGFVIPIGVTDTGQAFCFDVDLRKRERYMAINWTGGASASGLSAIAILSRGRVMPGTSAGNMVIEVVG